MPSDRHQPPLISVIVPVWNGGDDLRRCLRSLGATTYRHWELIVVDDGSADDSAQTAVRHGARAIFSAPPQGGPARARNRGAREAGGAILLFVDSDVMVRPDTVGRVARLMSRHPEVSACFGSYDDAPAAETFLSQYKNLLHHYVHQTAASEAATFWAGCGAIRREVFLSLGGYDTRFPRPSIEDIELGNRLRAAGHRILLDRHLQVKHLKRWSARSLLITDIRDRALPWSRLMLTSGSLLNDLNLKTGQRVSAVACLAAATSLLLGVLYPPAAVAALPAVAVLILLNLPFYRFLGRKKGFLFLLGALPWHWFYFLYSLICFVFCWAEFKWQSRGGASRPVSPTDGGGGDLPLPPRPTADASAPDRLR
jgi:glycosyltransferase involved in cell wall biosynthesis